MLLAFPERMSTTSVFISLLGYHGLAVIFGLVIHEKTAPSRRLSGQSFHRVPCAPRSIRGPLHPLEGCPSAPRMRAPLRLVRLAQGLRHIRGDPLQRARQLRMTTVSRLARIANIHCHFCHNLVDSK